MRRSSTIAQRYWSLSFPTPCLVLTCLLSYAMSDTEIGYAPTRTRDA